MNDLAQAYVAYYLQGEEKHYWSVEKLNDMTVDDPEKAWEIIKEINLIEVSGSEWQDHINAVVGCGPLENLVALHSNKLLGAILLEAMQNKK